MYEQSGRLNLKLLAEQAKKRLARNARVSSGVCNQTTENPPKIRYIQEKVLLSNEEDELLYSKLKEIFSQNENVTNPIGQLIDQTKFKSLSTLERDAYIVRMIEKFNTLKDRFNKEKNDNQLEREIS
ncbi:MAG: hypothetical protein WCR30_00555 [Clostridia bacterium]